MTNKHKNTGPRSKPMESRNNQYLYSSVANAVGELVKQNREYRVLIVRALAVKDTQLANELGEGIKANLEAIFDILKPLILTKIIPFLGSLDGTKIAKLSIRDLDWLAEASTLLLAMRWESREGEEPFQLNQRYLNGIVRDALRDGWDVDPSRRFSRPVRRKKFQTELAKEG